MQSGIQGRLRNYARWLWIYFVYASGLTRWARNQLKASRGILVLTLHRVLDDADFSATNSPPGMVVRKRTFQDLLQYLREHCEVVSIGDPLELREGSTDRPLFAVTFDDGWKDTALVAFPAAVEKEIPIAVFVCPGLLGETLPFWPERVLAIWKDAVDKTGLRDELAACCRSAGLVNPFASDGNGTRNPEALLAQLKDLSVCDLDAFVKEIDNLARIWGCTEPIGPLEATMTRREMAELSQRGVAIGSHTQHHAILTRLPESHVAAELTGAKREIELILGCPCTLFSYPNGSWSPEVRKLVRKDGYTQAFVNEPGIWSSSTDPWLIPRVNIWEGSLVGPRGRFSPVLFQYNTFWRAHRAEKRKLRRVTRSVR
jgi:peptidoglycan/xylan/chitin deacetylase (PgdA/CDA1 family)